MTLPIKPISLKQEINEFDQQLNHVFLTDSIQSLMNQRSHFFDELLIKLWQEYELHMSTLSLNAVGGYGRNTLHPRSDIDITILSMSPLTRSDEETLSLFLTKLWDLGCDIGHSVRTIDETIKYAESDITIATNLLDIRTIVGNNVHAKTILDKLYTVSIWTTKDFYQAKLQEQDNRHKKAKNTALYLEPNIKNNPGGMRDLQTIDWLAQKHFQGRIPDRPLEEYLTSDEVFELSEAYDYICRVRWALHTYAKRPEEKLLFEYQADVANFMGFGGEDNQLSIENMMRQLYRAMTRVREFNQMITSSLNNRFIQNSRSHTLTVIDNYFHVENGLITAKFDEVFIDKRQVMRMFYLIAQDEKITGISPKTLRLLRQNRRRLLGELIDYQACREEFINVISHQNGLKNALSLMHRYGVLASYSSQWRWIEGKMQFDMHNAFTVDEHVFRTAQALGEFNQIGDETKLINQVTKRVKDRTALVLSALLHHISGEQCINNNELSAVQAKQLTAQHTHKKSTINLVYWLVANQNLLVCAIQRLDINDPNVIKSIAKDIGDEDKLNALYAFTVADMMATNHEYWNDWQESLLNKLYLSVRHALKSGLEKIFEQRVIIKENKASATQELQQLGYDIQAINHLWKQLPAQFLGNNKTGCIVPIAQKLLDDSSKDTFVFFIPNISENYTQLVVYTDDRKKLFVDIFNVLSIAKLHVKDAQIMQAKNGKILEIIKLLDHQNKPLTESFRMAQLENRILKAIEEKKTPTLPTMPNYTKSFDTAPEVEILDSNKEDKLLLKISTLDNPENMENICSVFSSLSFTIDSAKITVLGESTENVFLISNNSESVINNDEKRVMKEAILEKLVVNS